MEFKNYTAQDSKGRVLSGATANIYQTGTQIVVSVFDEDGNGVSQPLTADSFGQFSFAAANGSYDVAVTYGGSTSTIENERFFDPEDQASVAETLTNKTIDTANNTITVNLSDVSDWPASVSATEAGYLDGVTSGIQGQIDGKQDILSEGAFADGDKDKLDGIETGATADQTGAEIKALYEAESDTNAFTDADHSKLDGIEASADVTDTANVSAAGAVMVRSIITDVTNVESNTDLTYTAGQAGTVAEGDNVVTLDGHSFEVAASGASDHHRTTSGGVKLYVLPDARGYNVRAFGATGDGTTDDSDAFSTMFTWVMSDDGGWRKCYAPAGRYAIETQYSTTVDNYDNSAFQGLLFEGDGPSTVIVNKNGKGFFKWVQSSARDVRAKMQNFVIELAKTGSNGTLIHLEQLSGGLSKQRDVELRDIQVAPTDSALDCYVVSYFRIQGFYFPRIENCSVHSGFASGNTLRRYYKGRISIWLQDCYGYELIDTQAWGCEEGLRAFEDNDPGGEGGRVSRGVLDAWHSLRVFSPGTEPAFTVDDVHLNGVATCLEIEQRKLIQARGNWYYMTESTADASVENLLAYSHDATNWTGTATVTAAADENGFYDVYNIEDTGSGQEYIGEGFARTSGTDYVVSPRLKYVDAAESYVAIVDNGSLYGTTITWDGENEPTLTDDAGVTGEAIDYGDGWWRIVLTRNVSTTETADVRIYPAGTTGASTGSVLFAGAQAQEGTEATPIVRTEGSTATQEPVDIRLKGVEECDNHDLTFWFDGSTARKNIVADGDCRRLRFRNLVHNGVVDTAYDLASGIDEVFISNPYFNSGITNEIVDGGVTKLRVRRDDPLFAKWSLGSAQSIPNNSDTTITWDTVEDYNGFGDTAGAAMTVPSNAGVRQARITLSGRWANNSTGVRILRATVNNVNELECPHEIKQAASVTNTMVSSTVPVTGGDVIRVIVLQNSGGALNIGGAGKTFVHVELE